jgi:hypothetical protein
MRETGKRIVMTLSQVFNQIELFIKKVRRRKREGNTGEFEEI